MFLSLGNTLLSSSIAVISCALVIIALIVFLKYFKYGKQDTISTKRNKREEKKEDEENLELLEVTSSTVVKKNGNEKSLRNRKNISTPLEMKNGTSFKNFIYNFYLVI